MTLPLDLGLLESDAKFQQFCFRILRKEFPNAFFVAIGSWDGGRDILEFNNDDGDVIWQCKFTRRGITGALKKEIVRSLDSLDISRVIEKWILCLSVNPSGVFLDWLRDIIRKYHLIKSWEVWGQEVLLQRLENYPDILEAFFYPVWKALESRFRTENLELARYELDAMCGWRSALPRTLVFSQDNTFDNDLIFDITVRNRGTIETLIHSVRLEITEVRRYLLGLPGEGLLFPQITYVLPLKNGTPGVYVENLEPPLIVGAGKHERFKIRLTEAGYAWCGFVHLTLIYSDKKELSLPRLYLFA